MTPPDHPWSIPVAVANVPESGLHIEATADPATRAAIAKLAGVKAVPRLAAVFDVARRGKDGLHVTGTVSGAVEQTCVVTLEPVENTIDEAIDLTFTPPRAGDAVVAPGEDHELVVHPEAADPAEELVDGAADLGRIATEFLVLAVDPYPRKPGAVFDAPQDKDAGASPFAALGALKKDGDKGG